MRICGSPAKTTKSVLCCLPCSGAVEHLKDDYWVNGSTTTWAQAAAAALNNGTDLECAQHNQGKLFNVMHLYLNQSYAEGLVTMTTWDRALERWFEKLFLLGTFDQSVSYRTLGAKDINTPDTQALALRAARESIVLLQNNLTKGGRTVLPLSQKSPMRLALIGPLVNASHSMQSDYTGSNNLVANNTPYLAIKRKVEQIGGSVIGNEGCAVRSADTSQISSAVAVCHAADVCILFLGMDNSIEGEGNDRQNIDLPGQQALLANTIIAIGKPTVVVLMGGAALAIADIKKTVPAIFNAFYPGEMGGDAITDVLFGDYSPSGRLTFTMYVAEITRRSMYDMSLRGTPGSQNGGITYQWYSDKFGQPLWPFGTGESFTSELLWQRDY